MLNNYVHDVATGLLLISALWLGGSARDLGPSPSAETRNLRRAFSILTRLIRRAGVQADYRAEFWSMFWTQLRQGRIENIFQIAMVAYHLIKYARDCVAGRMHASNYAHRIRPQPTGSQ